MNFKHKYDMRPACRFIGETSVALGASLAIQHVELEFEFTWKAK